MFTQQEVLESNRIYDAYKDQRILFSSRVTQSLGLKQQETVVKIGNTITRGALVSATMDDMVLIAQMDDSLQKKINLSDSLITVQLKFYDSLFKKETTFTLFTKFLNMNNNGLSMDNMHYLSLKFKRRIPNELISVFGKHHKMVRNSQVEGMLFNRGIKKPCTPLSVNDSTIRIKYTDDPTPYLYQKAIVVLKSTESNEVFEIIGRIDGNCTKEGDTYILKLNFTKEQQSPRFVQSLESLKKLIN